jgi:hypothetical protein
MAWQLHFGSLQLRPQSFDGKLRLMTRCLEQSKGIIETKKTTLQPSFCDQQKLHYCLQARSSANLLSITERMKSLTLADSRPLIAVSASAPAPRDDLQHTCSPASRTLANSAGENEPSLSNNSKSLSEVKPTAWTDCAWLT